MQDAIDRQFMYFILADCEKCLQCHGMVFRRDIRGVDYKEYACPNCLAHYIVYDHDIVEADPVTKDDKGHIVWEGGTPDNGPA